MRIAIDARWIFPEISGIGAYTRALIKNESIDFINWILAGTGILILAVLAGFLKQSEQRIKAYQKKEMNRQIKSVMKY